MALKLEQQNPGSNSKRSRPQIKNKDHGVFFFSLTRSALALIGCLTAEGRSLPSIPSSDTFWWCHFFPPLLTRNTKRNRTHCRWTTFPWFCLFILDPFGKGKREGSCFLMSSLLGMLFCFFVFLLAWYLYLAVYRNQLKWVNLCCINLITAYCRLLWYVPLKNENKLWIYS